MSEILDFLIAQGDQFRRARLPSLYSDFSPQRHSNPDGFAANTTAWIEALTKAARAGLLSSNGADRDILSLTTGENLLQSLETKEWGRPLALKTVIDEALAQRKLIPYEEFVTAQRPIHNQNRTIQPWQVFSWGLKQLGLLDWSKGAEQMPTANFVIVQNVEEAASKLLKGMGSQSNQINRIYPMSMFSTEVCQILNLRALTDNDLHLILKYLARDKSGIIYDTETVKFKSPGETSSTLSIQDKTVATLKALIAGINLQTQILSTRILNLSETAQKAINNKSRTSALAALRSKKLSEATLTQRLETLTQLEGVYSKIEQATDQVAVVRAMKASTGVLQNLHAQVGGIEKVEDVIEGLRNEMAKVDDIGSVIEAGAQLDSVVDERALDEELESLEKQASAREEEEGVYQMQKKLPSTAAIRETKRIQQKSHINLQELSSDCRELEPQIEEGIQ